MLLFHSCSSVTNRVLPRTLSITLAVIVLSATVVNAQEPAKAYEDASLPVPLPPPVIIEPYLELTQAPGFPESNPTEAPLPRPAASFMPPGTRAGAFQKINFRSSWMPQLEGDSIGATGVDLEVVFGVPFPERQSPLLITPAYRIQFLEGPDFTDVPSRLQDLELGFAHFRKINENWLFNGAVTVGSYADDYLLGDPDSIQITGRALGIYDFHNYWKGVVGVVYLNRAGLSVVPAAGLTYDAGDFQVDLIFPRPRVAWRTQCVKPGYDERWFYLQGEFGGGRWAVRRPDGSDDTLAYGDVRALVGIERKLIGGLSRRWELGYVFDRELEYDSEGYESELDDSFFLARG